jgi:SH3-like domain-containing protein
MKSAILFRSLVAAVCLAFGGASAAPVMAQGIQPLVIVPDNPGGGGGGGNVGRGNAVATANVNVRRGPGASHPVVDVLQRGDSVDIQRCSNGWCLIEHRGPPGWVSQNYLRRVVDSGPPSRPPAGGGGARREVCFFDRPDFRGASFCARPGESDNRLGTWDNRISSIQIDGFVTVQVCSDRNARDCTAYNRDVRQLPRWLDQNVSSFRVFH